MGKVKELYHEQLKEAENNITDPAEDDYLDYQRVELQNMDTGVYKNY